MLTNTLWLAQITNKATCLMASRKLEKVHSPSTMNFIFVYHKCFIFYNVDLYKLFDASGIEPPIYRLLKLIERHQIHISPLLFFCTVFSISIFIGYVSSCGFDRWSMIVSAEQVESFHLGSDGNSGSPQSKNKRTSDTSSVDFESKKWCPPIISPSNFYGIKNANITWPPLLKFSHCLIFSGTFYSLASKIESTDEVAVTCRCKAKRVLW